MSGAQLVSVVCGCGCGQETRYGRAVALVAQGQDRASIATILGITREHLKTLMYAPPKYIHGHRAGDPATRLRWRADRGRKRAMRLRQAAAERSSLSPLNRFNRERIRIAARDRQRALSEELRAADLMLMAPFVARPAPDLTIVRVSVLRTLDAVRARLADTERGSIEALRAKVGQGWRMDGFARDYRTVYLEDLATYRGDSSSHLDKLDTLSTPRVPVEEQLAHRVAEALLSLHSGSEWGELVHRALHRPDELEDTDRLILQECYSAVENSVLRGEHVGQEPRRSGSEPGGSVDRGGGLKRGRGRGRHGASRHLQGQKRFENREQIADSRLLRAARQTLRSGSEENRLTSL